MWGLYGWTAFDPQAVKGEFRGFDEPDVALPWIQETRFPKPDRSAFSLRLWEDRLRQCQLYHGENERREWWLYGRFFPDTPPSPEQLEQWASRFSPEVPQDSLPQDGAFLFILLDKAAQKCWVANDRGGRIPFYYALQEGRLFFGPRLYPFKKVLTPKLDETALSSFLYNGYILPDRTLYDGVRLLPPASCLEATPGEVRTLPAWQPDPAPSAEQNWGKADWQALFENMGEGLREMAGPEEEPLGLFLSGGMDSRLVLGLIHDAFPKRPLHLISYGHQANREGYDVETAGRVAAALELPLEVISWEAKGLAATLENFCLHCEGNLDEFPAYFGGFEYLRQARNKSRFWCMGGHNMGIKKLGKLDLHGVLNRCDIFYPDQLTPLRHLLRRDARRELRERYYQSLAEILRKTPEASPAEQHGHLYYHVRRARFLGAHKMVQRSFVEVVEPLLSRRVLDQTQGMPPQLREGKAALLQVLEERYPQLATLPRSLGKNQMDWTALFQRDENFRGYVRDQFHSLPPAFEAHFRKNELEHFAQECMGQAGPLRQGAQRLRKWWVQARKWEKNPERRPALKGKEYRILFRLLVLRNWCERYL